jgi:hypothetical protein
LRTHGVDHPRGVSARLVLFALSIVLTIPAASYAAPFRFGMSTSIVVRPNEDVSIFGEIVNTGDAPLVFGCALVPCGGLDFGEWIGAGLGEGLNALHLNEHDPTGSAFYAQFSGVTLAPGSAFDFVFATMSYDPSIAIGNPLGTVLHPIFGFRIGNDAYARIQPQVSIGLLTDVGAFQYVDAAPWPGNDLTPTPEPATGVLLGLGLGAGWFVRRRNRSARVR